jgi:hypothetical protein
MPEDVSPQSAQDTARIISRILKLCERPINPALAYRNLEIIKELTQKLITLLDQTPELTQQEKEAEKAEKAEKKKKESSKNS